MDYELEKYKRNEREKAFYTNVEKWYLHIQQFMWKLRNLKNHRLLYDQPI